MEIEVKPVAGLDDGKHEGVITRVEYRDVPYKYTDVFIKEKISEYELKYGCPTAISEKSKLGKLLSQFEELVVGQKVDPEVILKDQQVFFMTMQEQGKDGTFTRIVDGSVKPTVKKAFEGVEEVA